MKKTLIMTILVIAVLVFAVFLISNMFKGEEIVIKGAPQSYVKYDVQKELSICQKTTTDKGECYNNLAVESGEISYCGSAGDKKDNCYFYFAINNKDKSICELTNIKELCIERVEQIS